MKMITHYVMKPAVAVLAVVLATGMLAATAEAASKSNHETVNISEYTDRGTPGMAKIAVDSGRALIAHLSTAHALLDTNQIPEAHGALIACREFADATERSMPYLTIVKKIRDASKRIVEEDVQTLSTNLLPIYVGLDELQIYAPKVTRRTRGVLKQVKKHAAAGDKKHAAKMLTEAADDISRSTVYLPVEYVGQQVRVALYALDQTKPDIATAEAAVDRALDSVSTVIDEVVSSAN